MSDTAKRFRQRAMDCRNLAKSAKTPDDAAMLEEIAADLEAEADNIMAEELAKGGFGSPVE